MVRAARGNESGQAVTEYLLLLLIVVGAYLLGVRLLGQTRFAEKLAQPIREKYAAAYKYGNPNAKGPDEGAPHLHPRANTGVDGADDTCFRIFINPG